MRFRHDDRGGEVLRGGPVALAYADPRHAVVLPPGAIIDLRQYAGRVYNVAATPHMAALAPNAARQLADSVARLFAGAGWAPVPGAGTGDAAAAVRAALASQDAPNPGLGAVDVGAWRVPRPAAAWAALPPGAAAEPGAWDGTEALVQVKPLRHAPAASDGAMGAGRLVVQVEFEDTALRGALSAQVQARRHPGSAP